MNISYNSIKLGDKSSYSKVITQNDVELFAKITGDFSEIHFDDHVAKQTIFGSRIVHGVLVEGLISTAVSKLPGIIIYISQSSRFIKPVRENDRIDAIVEVIEKNDEKDNLKLKTICRNQRGEIILEGEAKVKVLEK